MPGIVHKTLFGMVCASIFLAGPAWADNAAKITLEDGRTAIIANGALEAASAGSYSIAVYDDDALIDFVMGTVQGRDGSLFTDAGEPRVEYADINNDGNDEMIIVKLTAGSGNYMQVDALSVGENAIKLVTRLETDGSQDYIAQLKQACEQGKCATVEP